ncbi:uncharacterized protein V1478_008797 [Vespula squamosa]|uniref:Uncharacterized protein n=1 Tax=Vespula squamosa TaxID=30214 RepID=A0ABD2AUJ4_VESSQ
MDAIISTTSFHYLMSKFCNLLTTLKQKIDELRTEIRENINNFNKNDQHIVTSNQETEPNIKLKIYVTILDLEKQLNILENTFNDSWLRIFLYVSNYVCTVPLIKEVHDEMTRNIIRMHKITFPEYNENNFKQNEKCLLEVINERLHVISLFFEICKQAYVCTIAFGNDNHHFTRMSIRTSYKTINFIIATNDEHSRSQVTMITKKKHRYKSEALCSDVASFSLTVGVKISAKRQEKNKL